MLAFHHNDLGIPGQFNDTLIQYLPSDKNNAFHIHHFGSPDHLRIIQSGQQDTLILNKGKDVAHQIASAG
ncbi:hypothetical protein SDC9_135418 [bioreactor metagenome]|uniref:Uncharacterized protein n=1 Tax=bioreactor metagenome TaxID=1076179 RepID=A0A645DG48_9ZZZZ